jgi:hypothetical protein
MENLTTSVSNTAVDSATIISDITVGAAGVTTLNVLPNELNYNGIGTLIVTVFTCLMQWIKYREEVKRKQQKQPQ